MMLPFEPRAGLVVVPLKLFGPDTEMITRFVVDTGATRSIVNRPIATSLGYSSTGTSADVQLTTASGMSAVAEIIVQRIEVLGQVRDNFPMLCSAFPHHLVVDGMLGLDFLRGQRLTLDFKTGLHTLD